MGVRALRRGTVAGRSAGLLASDSFNRADGPLGTADIGGAWATTGTWSIVSGQARNAGSADYDLATLNVSATAVDVRITIDPAAGTLNDVGPAVHVIDASNFIFLDFTFTGGNTWLCKVFQRVAGAFTGLTTLVDPIPQLGADNDTPFRARLVTAGSYGPDGGEAFIAAPATPTTWVSVGSWVNADVSLRAATSHGFAAKTTPTTRFDDITIAAAP